ncbi:MAG: hypothetical protein ABTQ32_37220 [Myxococcaceae bacterium]
MAAVRFAKFVPEQVLRDAGLHRRFSVEQLVTEAKKFDTKNKGYLSQDEFLKAAEALKAQGGSTTGQTKGYRFAQGTLRDVHQEYLRGNPNKRFTEAQLVRAAAVHDGGDKYLSRAELEAGAIDLQRGVDAGTLSNKLAALWEGRKFPAALSRAPSTADLRSFEAPLAPRSVNDDVSALAFVDEAKNRVLVKVSTNERLPWEGATSASTAWYAIPLQSLR